MRTIKFRAKEVCRGEWITGDLVHYTHPMREKVCIHDYETGIEHDVAEDTVGQYIGREDCDGTPIYEGDIISVNGRYPKVVRYIDEWHSFCVANLDAITDPCMSRWDDVCNYQQPAPNWWNDFKREIKVIANEYDNPELVKVKK